MTTQYPGGYKRYAVELMNGEIPYSGDYPDCVEYAKTLTANFHIIGLI